MKVTWLISSCLAAIDIGNIKLPSPETLGIQYDLPFLADRIRNSLEVEDRSQYLQATKELLEELSDEDRFLKYQHLAHQELLDLNNFGEAGELVALRSNSEKYFERVMIEKCGISDKKFEAVEKYVLENGLEHTCLRQLKQWNKDLVDGNWYGQRICDSWGEKIVPRNMPGVQFLSGLKTVVAEAYLGIVNPGLVDQCKTTVRPPVEANVVSGFDGSYKGQYVDTRRFRRTWLLDTGFGTILETLACANACGEDEECQAECYTGFRFFPAWGHRGKCYPDACSAAEIVILEDGIFPGNVTSFYFGDVGQQGQNTAKHAWNFNSKVATYTEPKLERVYLPTFISFVSFCGIWILIIGAVSFKYSKNVENNVPEKNNNFVMKVFAYQPHWAKVCSSKRSKKAVKCLDGIRTISTFWVMLGHFYLQIALARNSEQALDNMKEGKYSPIFNATVSVDTFFCIGGLLLAYLSTDKILKSFNTVRRFLVNYPFYLINRYMRLTPMILMTAWFAVAIAPLVAEGKNPVMPTYFSRACEHDLWKTVFYISGWLENPSGVCNAVQWYLSNDFFYFAIFPFIALAYGRHKIAGIVVCLACIFGSIGHNLWASLDLNSHISQTYKIYSAWPTDRAHDPYFAVWARYHSHGVGILFGWFLLEERRSQFFSKFLDRRRGLVKLLIVLAMYSVGVFALYFPIYGINACFHVQWEDGIGDYFNVSTIESVSGCLTKDGELDWTAIAIWNAIHRPLWCIGVGSIVVICDLNYGFLINWFLSCKPLLFVAKLSYCMYLFHYFIIGMWEGNIKFDPINDDWFFSFLFSGLVLFVILSSAIWHVIFEAPFGTAWAEVFKMITAAMSPPPKTVQKVSEEKPMTEEEKPEEKSEEKTEEKNEDKKVEESEMQNREDVEMKTEKQENIQAAAEL